LKEDPELSIKNLSAKEQLILITSLEQQLEDLEQEQTRLKQKNKTLVKKSSRFHDLFKNSTVAIIEEDLSDASILLKQLPCSSREEYSEYLSGNEPLLKQLISSIRVLDVNDAAIALHGAVNKEHLISSLDKLFIEESYNTFIDQFSILASEGDHYECETLGRKLDGEEFNVHLSAYYPDSEGRSVMITMMEITDRVRFLQQQTRKLSDIRKSKKKSDTLLKMTMDLSSKKNEKDILDTLLKQVNETVPYDTANIMLLQNSELVVVAHRGYENFGIEKFIDNLSTKLSSIGVFKTFNDLSKTLIIEDTSHFPGWEYFKETEYIKSVLSVGIEWQGEPIGLLTLDSVKTGTFSLDDAEKLKNIYHAAAITLQKSRMFKQAENDISERVKAEGFLIKDISEKELLLKEIHHRVKNNLAIIIALINLQNSKVSGKEEEDVFEELHLRVHAVALVHDKLYENHNIASIDFYSYVNDLVNSIRQLSVNCSEVTVSIDIDPDIYFDTDTLVPLGLIMNELLTNSFKYAYPDYCGELSVSLSLKKQKYFLEVRDSGPGYSEDILGGDFSSLGLVLVHTLADQIRGSVLMKNDDGAIVVIEFPYAE